MFESIWEVMANYGMDLTKIANFMAGIFAFDEETGIATGTLAPLADFPVIGDILKAIAGLAPVVGDIG